LILIENILNDQIKKYVETMIDLKKLNWGKGISFWMLHLNWYEKKKNWNLKKSFDTGK
jgi:hypothetical protein